MKETMNAIGVENLTKTYKNGVLALARVRRQIGCKTEGTPFRLIIQAQALIMESDVRRGQL